MVGGATIVVFSMITMSGMSLVAKSRFTSRSMLICGISLTLGLGISFAKDTLNLVGGYVQMLSLIHIWARRMFPAPQRAPRK